MKTFFFTLFIIIITCSLPAVGQTVSAPKPDIVRDSTYYTTYNTLKQLYIEETNTAEYQKYSALLRIYKKKLRSTNKFKTSLLVKDQGGLNWLKNNWDQTEFTSYEEAVDEYDKVLKALADVDKHHPEFNNFNAQAIIKYGPEIFTDVYFEIMAEYPDKF